MENGKMAPVVLRTDLIRFGSENLDSCTAKDTHEAKQHLRINRLQ
jgi:hypothetical protein